MPTTNKFWAGTADSFNAAVAGMEKAQAFISMGGDAPDLPSLWGKQDGLAVIDISGATVSGSSGFGRFFGVIGYDDIRAAIVEAVSDPEVKSVLLHINSGGGAVMGASDLNQFIAKVCKSKPMATYSDGILASAAYWYGCATGNISASSTSIVGSLGVLSTHVERSVQLANDGVKVTVVRAGKYKALTNSVEPLSEEGLAGMQTQVNALYDIFMTDVAKCRKTTVSSVDSEMGQGREFIGKASVAVGLVDKIANYDQAIAAAKTLDSSVSMVNNPSKPKGSNMKATLTEAQLAALAAGATLEAVTAATVTDEVITPAPAAAVTEPDAVPAAAPAPAAIVEGNATAVLADPAVVALLQAQLATASDALVASKVETATFKAQVDAHKATHDGLLAIARASIGKMSIALGGNASTAANLDATAAVAEYSRVIEVFNSKFKVGGVAATAQATSKSEIQLSPLQMAMIQAANGK